MCVNVAVTLAGVLCGNIKKERADLCVKRDCIYILIQKRDCSIVYFFAHRLLKLRQVLKLSLNMPELVLLHLEVENYVQN